MLLLFLKLLDPYFFFLKNATLKTNYLLWFFTYFKNRYQQHLSVGPYYLSSAYQKKNTLHIFTYENTY